MDPEMRLPAGPCAGVTFVLMRFIHNVEALGREGRRELFRDHCPGLHGT
jgi:hypothetical protein